MTLQMNKVLSYLNSASDNAVQAMIHKSYYNENRSKTTGHNERLEFLGDAVLDLIVSKKLFVNNPNLSEGGLSKVRSSLVNEVVLAEIALKINIDNKIQLGKGELKTGGKDKPRLLSSAFEALVGAMYLDLGLEEIISPIYELFESYLSVEFLNSENLYDAKTNLQEMTQETNRTTPIYEIVDEVGPDHNKVFKVNLLINGKLISCGTGKTKKSAEQSAAKEAIKIIYPKGVKDGK